MALYELPGTIDFLTDAAHLLRTTAPETSAHLMSQRSHLLQQAGVQPTDVQRQRVCNACGHIMIPGKETALKIESRKVIGKGEKTSRATGIGRNLRSPGDPPPKTKTLRCGSCEKITRISLPLPGPAVRRKALGTISSSVKRKPSPPPAEVSKTTANASSKKRAKNRKAGLQALLSGQKQQAANPLSLANFMRK